MEEEQVQAQILSGPDGDNSNDCVSSKETSSNMPQPARKEVSDKKVFKLFPSCFLENLFLQYPLKKKKCTCFPYC